MLTQVLVALEGLEQERNGLLVGADAGGSDQRDSGFARNPVAVDILAGIHRTKGVDDRVDKLDLGVPVATNKATDHLASPERQPVELDVEELAETEDAAFDRRTLSAVVGGHKAAVAELAAFEVDGLQVVEVAVDELAVAELNSEQFQLGQIRTDHREVLNDQPGEVLSLLLQDLQEGKAVAEFVHAGRKRLAVFIQPALGPAKVLVVLLSDDRHISILLKCIQLKLLRAPGYPVHTVCPTRATKTANAI